MAFTKTVFIIYAISIHYLADRVIALRNEAILNGIPVETNTFTYHVSVIGLRTEIKEYNLLGGGAIISNKHIISAASIFLFTDGTIQPWKFAVVVGIHDISKQIASSIIIRLIYFTSYDQKFIYFNLAVAELMDGVGLGDNPSVSKVTLPNSHENFILNATVSGFGLIQIQSEENINFPTASIENGMFFYGLSPVLRYQKVSTIYDYQCAQWYPREVTATNICGVMEKKEGEEEIVGICEGDVGGPLVAGKDLLIGIASKITPDCDNTIAPALYMKISPFRQNINNFIDGIIAHDAFVLNNNFLL